MPKITFEGNDYECSGKEPLLDALFNEHGVFLPHSCKSGSCHACLMKVRKGTPPAEAQFGLKDTLKAQNYFLPCICKHSDDMEIARAETVDSFSSLLLEKRWLNKSIILLRLQCPDHFKCKAGQFINLSHPDGQTIRSYSLANVSHEGFLELHVKRVADGIMSNWLCDTFNVGDNITFHGAHGDCFYVDTNLNQPLILAGTGTGLAPLYGIVREALASDHQGSINLFHASLAAEGLYYTDELKILAQQHEQLNCIACVLHGQAPENGLQGRLDQLITKILPDCYGQRAYLCGDPATIDAMQKAIFFAGGSMRDIYADAFTATP